MLSSQPFEATGPKGRCLTFWYYNSGSSNSSSSQSAVLSITLKDLATDKTTYLWLSNLPLTTTWAYGSVGFYFPNGLYAIQMIVVASGSLTVVAVDDVIFREAEFCTATPIDAGAMPGLPLPSAGGGNGVRTTTASSQSGTTPKPSTFNCDFEKDFCSWAIDPTVKLKWQRNKGLTGTTDTGPSFDHT
jgi:hypothetical protein